MMIDREGQVRPSVSSRNLSLELKKVADSCYTAKRLSNSIRSPDPIGKKQLREVRTGIPILVWVAIAGSAPD